MTLPSEQRSRKRRTSSAAQAAADPDGLRAQGVRTRNTIVRVARKLLLEGGPLEFSLRAVALGAGISVSNLQYYFPTRPAVLRAVMAPIITAYLDALKHALDNNVPAKDVLEAMMERAASDAKDSKNVALWWHFVSFASTDAECAGLLDEWYETLTRELGKLIRAANPKHSAAGSVQIAALLMAMADGLTLHMGTGRSKRAYTRGLDARFLAAAKQLIWGELPEAPQE
ncbi:TetR/AcrR family transcriptional regulator [Trinickia dinghuensis]|uniref:TetR/AcrR family transcriptional regulator n=1 Tax=Trinickia dinghuensis TaxID=2291023 RepID=A0A3D8JS15_9BURK|nr:TetR/AcrR family transcriptional regulator [Trinickia dinghuensis]RDU95903.1 TetR/AcrR family transcriptional regulator [Trinickia dinghuensis]